MKIVETITRVNSNGNWRGVLVESVADDVAAYLVHSMDDMPTELDATVCGHKMTEREAIAFGFTVPEGKHYRR